MSKRLDDLMAAYEAEIDAETCDNIERLGLPPNEARSRALACVRAARRAAAETRPTPLVAMSPVPAIAELKADAERMRWMLNGDGRFPVDIRICTHSPCSQEEMDHARAEIDKAMQQDKETP